MVPGTELWIYNDDNIHSSRVQNLTWYGAVFLAGQWSWPNEKPMKNGNESSDILNEAKIPLANSETALTMTSNRTWVCLKIRHQPTCD